MSLYDMRCSFEEVDILSLRSFPRLPLSHPLRLQDYKAVREECVEIFEMLVNKATIGEVKAIFRDALGSHSSYPYKTMCTLVVTIVEEKKYDVRFKTGHPWYVPLLFFSSPLGPSFLFC